MVQLEASRWDSKPRHSTPVPGHYIIVLVYDALMRFKHIQPSGLPLMVYVGLHYYIIMLYTLEETHEGGGGFGKILPPSPMYKKKPVYNVSISEQRLITTYIVDKR